MTFINPLPWPHGIVKCLSNEHLRTWPYPGWRIRSLDIFEHCPLDVLFVPVEFETAFQRGFIGRHPLFSLHFRFLHHVMDGQFFFCILCLFLSPYRLFQPFIFWMDDLHVARLHPSILSSWRWWSFWILSPLILTLVLSQKASKNLHSNAIFATNHNGLIKY